MPTNSRGCWKFSARLNLAKFDQITKYPNIFGQVKNLSSLPHIGTILTLNVVHFSLLPGKIIVFFFFFICILSPVHLRWSSLLAWMSLSVFFFPAITSDLCWYHLFICHAHSSHYDDYIFISSCLAFSPIMLSIIIIIIEWKSSTTTKWHKDTTIQSSIYPPWHLFWKRYTRHLRDMVTEVCITLIVWRN